MLICVLSVRTLGKRRLVITLNKLLTDSTGRFRGHRGSGRSSRHFSLTKQTWELSEDPRAGRRMCRVWAYPCGFVPGLTLCEGIPCCPPHPRGAGGERRLTHRPLSICKDGKEVRAVPTPGLCGMTADLVIRGAGQQ